MNGAGTKKQIGFFGVAEVGENRAFMVMRRYEIFALMGF